MSYSARCVRGFLFQNNSRLLYRSTEAGELAQDKAGERMMQEIGDDPEFILNWPEVEDIYARAWFDAVCDVYLEMKKQFE